MLLIIGFAILLIGLAIAVHVHYSKPEGMFDDPQIGAEGFSYWEFKDGEAWLVTPDESFFEGWYFNLSNRWMYQAWSARDSGCFLKTTVLGFKLVDSNGKTILPQRRRIFIRPTVPKQKDENLRLF